MKKLLIPVLAAAIITSASCSKSSGPSTPQAQVMFMNAWLVTNSVNVTANNVSVSTNLGFLKNTGYQNVAAGVAEDLAFLLPSPPTKLIDTTVTLTANTHYSVYITGVTPLAQVMTSDDVTAPTSGMAKVRFVNLSPDTVGYNVYIGSTLVSGADTKYRGVTSFTSIAATSGAVLVSDPNNVPIQTILSNQTFSAGKIYTIVLTGQYGASSTTAITILNNN